MGEGVEWALHAVVLLALSPRGTSLPAARLAEFHGVPPAYLAKTMQALAAGGVVTASVGRHGGYRLARPPADITVWEVVRAVEGDEAAFRCTEIRRQGPARVRTGYGPVCAVAAVMARAEAAWRRELAAVTLAELARTVAATVPPEAARRATAWLSTVSP